ncbi:P-loop NTPase family protein [Methylosarcina fibrata]|uniref:hypothetical protein n=1 Tax=Methylosarcina fibrata TaxID=105972 RepID=UPI0003641390|nr:hypothetical protein [Methylosarcina fibrata]
MAEKTVSKYLLNLEKYFANDNPILQKASRVFHELDQLEYDLSLLDTDETTAVKNSWWPIITLIGGSSTAKSRFMNGYFGSDMQLSGIQTSGQKFTVLLHNAQPNSATLPGTALDVDHRFPFYQISQKIEQQQPGEGGRINSYLELKTIPSERLKGRLFIDAPDIDSASVSPITRYLTRYSIEHSDLVLIFTDTFDSSSPMVDELLANIASAQDSSKFTYLIDAPGAALSSSRHSEIIASWQRKLAEKGITGGQFLILPGQEASFIPQTTKTDFSSMDQYLATVANNRTYRILQSLEQNIREIEGVVIPEVKKGITTWKERATMSSLLILSFIIVLSLFAEINSGIVLATLVDPILGPISLLVLIAFMIPIHLVISKLHAKVIINQLNARQKELHLLENLSNLFEKNLTFARIVLPISEPAGWNKKTKSRLAQLSAKTQELVQALNDSFSAYNEHLVPGFSDTSGH